MVLSKTWNGTTYSIPQSGERGWASLTNFLSALADGAQSTGKQLIGRRVATTSPVTITATTDAYVGVNVSAAVAAVSLPAGVAGQVFYIADESGAAATYNITITPNGAETIGGAATYILNANSQAIGIVYSGTDWKLFANFTPVAVTPSSTTTFTNKKLVDSSVTFVDDGDDTKQFAVQCSGITTGTTRTWTVPNSNDTFVGKATTDILTNKTLNGNTATNLISGSGTLTLNTNGTATVQSTTGTIPSQSYAAVATTATINAMVNTQSVAVFTGSTNTALNGIAAGFLGQRITLINVSTGTITLSNASGSAAVGDKLLLPTGSSFILPSAAVSASQVQLIYTTYNGANYWYVENTSLANFIMGSITGVAPFAGQLGQQIISSVSGVSAGTSGQFSDTTSISLTAGCWDVYLFETIFNNGATITAISSGISSTAGNDATGLTRGLNRGESVLPNPWMMNTIPAYRVNLSGTTTYYLKNNLTYTVATPLLYSTLKAVRVG